MQQFWLERVTTGVTKILTVIAAACLTIMMLLTAADVGFRYFLNSPIPGALELAEFLMAIIVPFSIAYCAFDKSHVAVELIVDHLPKKVQKICNFIITLPTIGFILLISWQNYYNIIDVYDQKLTSAVLKIPAFPFAIPLAIGSFVFAVIMIVHLFESKSKETSHGSN